MSEKFMERKCQNCMHIICEDLQCRQDPNFVCDKHKFEHEAVMEQIAKRRKML